MSHISCIKGSPVNSLQTQMQMYDGCSFSVPLINDERRFLYLWGIYKYETHKIDLITI